MTFFNRCLLLAFAALWSNASPAQAWIDTAYSYQLTTDVVYGNAVDFAGNERELKLDLCVPTNDVPPACGRPLMVVVHGGAWMAGSKNDPMIQRLMKDFAKRGYVTASVNYRLGMFQTNQFVNCNVSSFNLQWNCFNQQDSLEWYRAWFRGVQDVKGAIRFLINNATQHNIDPRNVFVVGESAGGFIALGVGFLDDDSEKPQAAFAQTNALQPNALYETQCVQGFGLDTSIASLQLSRPDLGSIHGSLHTAVPAYRIRGVGNFYGGMFYNLLATNSYDSPPAIYLFHQPNDLIVSHERQRLLSGYAYCATFFGCQYIVNRPFASGSAVIRDYIQQLQSADQPIFVYDSTLNNADCAQQALDPNTGGHQVDNYWLRSVNMALLFAARVDTSTDCTLFTNPRSHSTNVAVYPNPTSGSFAITGIDRPTNVVVTNATGHVVFDGLVTTDDTVALPTHCSGVLFVSIFSSTTTTHLKVILTHR